MWSRSAHSGGPSKEEDATLRFDGVNNAHLYYVNYYSFDIDHDDGDGLSIAMARIRDVWAPNLEIEMRNIREAIDRCPYIAMVRPLCSALYKD
jgi:hypothetical protein